MRRVLKFLVRLYPSGWRKRYGAEYAALLDETKPRARDVSDVLWQAFKMQARRSGVRVMLSCAACGALIATSLSFAVSRQYVSQVVIWVNTIGTVAGVTDASVPDIGQPFFDDASLAAIVQKLDIYPRERSRMSLADVTNRMRKDIEIRPMMKEPGQSAFALRFSYPDPHVAQQVDTELAAAFMTMQVRGAMTRPPNSPKYVLRIMQMPDLPLRASSPKRGVFVAGGLFAGIVAGLMLTAVMQRRRETLAAK